MIISLTGPSGIGKGYVKEKLIERYPFIKELTWVTTRTLRPDECQKSNRENVSVQEFRTMEARGELILVQELYNHYYGLRKYDLQTNDGQVFLTEFHIDNLVKIVASGIPVLPVALVPSDISFLHKRLAAYRNTENADEMKQRLALVKAEIEQIKNHHLLFLAVIEISENTETTVVSRVLKVLNPHIDK